MTLLFERSGRDPSVSRDFDRVKAALLPLQAATDITGSRGGNAALANLLTALATAGLIVDSTTA